ncbi:MAG: hypothetical protein AAGK23_10110, partial [Pseudomonadota bacterium]
KTMLEVFAAEDDQACDRALAQAIELAGRGSTARFLSDIRHGVPLANITPTVAVIGDMDMPVDFQATLSQAMSFVTEKLKVPPPVLLINLLDGPADLFVEGGSDGFGVLTLSRDYLSAPDLYAALVHELTHAVVLSGNLFLDEGLAVAMESEAVGTPPSAFSPGETAPLLSSILSADWSGDPYLTALTRAGISAPHAYAAKAMAEIIRRAGVSLAFMARFIAFSKIRLASGEAVAALKDVLELDAGDIGVTENRDIEPALASLIPAAARALALGDASSARGLLPDVRRLQRYFGSAEAHAAAAKVYLCLALSGEKDTHLLTGEANMAIGIVLRTAPESSDGALLAAYDAILGAQSAVSPIERNQANGSAANFYAKALTAYPSNAEIVIAAAKAQTYLPDQQLSGQRTWPDLLDQFATDLDISPMVSALKRHPLLSLEAS